MIDFDGMTLADEDIQNFIRAMTEDQQRLVLTVIPYTLIYPELQHRYEHLLVKYTEDLERFSGAAFSIDTLPHR